jgi:hypothetical protein
MEKIKNKSNSDLAQIQKELGVEYERVRGELLKLYDYWMSLEKSFTEVNNELNDRFGVNNK